MKSYVISIALIGFIHITIAQIPGPGDAPKPKTPEESAKAFKLPEGFRMEVIAAEPLIASPTAVCWDSRGWMFVSELHGYNLEGQLEIEELNKAGKLDTEVRRVQADEKFKQAALAGTFGTVKRLKDLDGDGRMDHADTWAKDLPPIYGMVAARDGIIVASAPDIVFLADLNDDGIADVRETLFTGFRTGALERGINAPQWGVDGWIYFGRGWGGSEVTGPKLRGTVQLPDSDFRIRPDGSAIEPVTGGTHTFGFAMTATGDRFVVSTTFPGIYIAPLPWRYLARNPNAFMPSIEFPIGDRRVYEISHPHPWRQKRADDPAYFQYYNSRYGAAESEASGWFTAACGPMIYRDRYLPGLHGQYFVCEPSGNLIHRAIIEPDGSGLVLNRLPKEARSEFAATTDQWSHPISLHHGPDGSIWVVDYYREIIEDYSAIPRHLQQQYGVYAGHDRGRIYRLTHRDAPSAPEADLSKLSLKALVDKCASPLLWQRQTAQRLLVERGQQDAAPALRSLLKSHQDEPEAIIFTLRTLDLLGSLEPVDVIPFLRHPDSAVRIHALQLGDQWLARPEESTLFDAVLAAASVERNQRVQVQFALSLGESQDTRALERLATYARENLDVRWMDTALLSSLNGRTIEMMAISLPDYERMKPFLSMLARSIAAGRNQSDLARTLSLIASAQPTAQATLLAALSEGRKNALREPLVDPAARSLVAALESSPASTVRVAAKALAETFNPEGSNDESMEDLISTKTVETIGDEAFNKYVKVT